MREAFKALLVSLLANAIWHLVLTSLLPKLPQLF
jgi:uncharacterized membrane protein